MLRRAINRKVKELSKNKYSTIKNIEIDKEDSHIPINLPSAIIADKGSGKTILLKTIMEETYKNKQFQHIYFIFSPLSWDDELPSYITKININESEAFLSEYFKIKSLYISFGNFIEKLNEIQKKKSSFWDTLKEFIEASDNNIIKEYSSEFAYLTNALKNKDPKSEEDIKIEQYINKIISNSISFIKTYSKEFYIGTIKLDKINKNDRDCIVIDDIAIASKILFQQMKNSAIYQYLTLTRHMRLCVLFSGQQIDQIPKYIRREIMCWIVSKNTTLDLLDGIINKSSLNSLEESKNKLARYEFILYNLPEDFIIRI